ncbi:MAG: FAD synthetase [Candidatus Peregrinibacteria bacterium Gr01-1014_25]|nr:MAG: FAD synthetase [Candidatus Peregrinibacteria bacterium Gr01-1014_25]
MTRILLFGTFDGLHPGHRFVFAQALERAAGGEVYVVVARDANVQRIKGRPPRAAEDERARLISETYPTVHVLPGDPTDFLAPIRAVRPDRILLGYDQQLPPGVAMSDFPCPVDRLPAFKPETWKSSKL